MQRRNLESGATYHHHAARDRKEAVCPDVEVALSGRSNRQRWAPLVLRQYLAVKLCLNRRTIWLPVAILWIVSATCYLHIFPSPSVFDFNFASNGLNDVNQTQSTARIEKGRLGSYFDENRWLGLRSVLHSNGNHTFRQSALSPKKEEEDQGLLKNPDAAINTKHSSMSNLESHHPISHRTPINVVNNKLVNTRPYDESQIVKPTPGTSVVSNVTIVTAYFNVRSKHKPIRYLEWMRFILSLQDAMVIFTTPDMVPQIQSLRAHALNRTAIISMSESQLPIATMFSSEFWEKQFALDEQRKHHKSYQLFWIWLSKSWFVTDAISHNYFQSSIFVWSDIGCFRNSEHDGRTLVQHPGLVPRRAILIMAHSDFNPPKELFWNDKFHSQEHFYQAGALDAGYADTWQQFHNFFLETVDGFVKRGMFFGEDQVVLQSICRQHPSYCAYIHPADMVGWDLWEARKKASELDVFNGIRWFGLQRVLHYGGNFSYWYHPRLTRDEEEQLKDIKNKIKEIK